MWPSPAVQPTDPVAHDLYLQAAQYRNLVTLDGAERASDLYRQAIARDSSYADAWAGLAGAYQLLSQLGGPTPSETQVLLRRAVERAMGITRPRTMRSGGRSLSVQGPSMPTWCTPRS